MLAVVIGLLLCAVGAFLVARGSLAVMRRLGLDPVATLMWLGLAERPIEPRAQRRRLKELLLEAPPTRPAS